MISRFRGDKLPVEIDAVHAGALAPATHWLVEWRDYSLELEADENWHVVGGKQDEFGPWRRLWFENRVGLVRLERRRHGLPTGEVLHVEVLSTKANTPAAHLSLCTTLLDDLWRHAARLPFAFEDAPSRGVLEAQRPPTPLFALHFLTSQARRIEQALQVVAGQPHRLLRDREAWVRPGEATEVDADTLLAIAGHPELLVPCASDAPLVRALGGRAPSRVWQRLPEETCDTPENRFVRAFTEQLRQAAGDLPRQRWWQNVPVDKRVAVARVAAAGEQALLSEPLVDAGPMTRLPTNSQVLLRREGYRELLSLWRLFQLARRPLFGRLDEAMALRDVATLYEIWVFLELVSEIGEVLGEEPVIVLEPVLRPGLPERGTARFGTAGTLQYNYGRRGYSGYLRPDYLWLVGDRPLVAFDAKFRMTEPDPELGETEDTPERRAKRADLDKMHTYRDALGLKAAVCVYPGDVTRFWRTERQAAGEVTLAGLLGGEVEGIGALARRPGTAWTSGGFALGG